MSCVEIAEVRLEELVCRGMSKRKLDIRRRWEINLLCVGKKVESGDPTVAAGFWEWQLAAAAS